MLLDGGSCAVRMTPIVLEATSSLSTRSECLAFEYPLIPCYEQMDQSELPDQGAKGDAHLLAQSLEFRYLEPL